MYFKTALLIHCNQQERINGTSYLKLFQAIYARNQSSNRRFRTFLVDKFRHTFDACKVENYRRILQLIDEYMRENSDISFSTILFNRLTRIGCIDIDRFFAIIDRNGLSLVEKFYEIITNDSIFVNLVSRYAVGHVAAESEMLHLLIMKTRVVLSDFGIAAIKLNADIDRKMDQSCRLRAK